jgi:hypothetical protein
LEKKKSQKNPNFFIEKNDKIAQKKENTALHSFKLQTCNWKYTHYRKGLEITPQLQISDLMRKLLKLLHILEVII